MSASRAFAASTALGASLIAVAFAAKSGTDVGRGVAVDLAVLAAAAAVLALHSYRLPRSPAHGFGAVMLFAAFAGLTAVSVGWTISPDDTLREAGRVLVCATVFAAAVAGARLQPRAAHTVATGILTAGVAVCSWAILTRMFPGSLADEVLAARLGEPFGYWNALGSMAALSVPAALWLATRRDASLRTTALAYPAMGVLLLTILLTQSRGALVAAAIAALLWLAVVPVRLASLPVVALPSAAAGLAAAWALSKDAFTAPLQPLDAREAVAGDFALIAVAMVLALAVAGVAVESWRRRRPVSLALRRRTASAVGLVACAVALVAVGTVAASDRGLSGTISHRVDQLTSQDEGPPGGAARLGSVSSSRGQYWREAARSFEERPVIGAGANSFALARLPHRRNLLIAGHAHGFGAQVLSDLGLVGAALALALLCAWLVAAARAAGLPSGRRPAPEWTEDRRARVALALCAVAFGLQSAIDWTWFVPATVLAAIVAAGYLAGLGPGRRSGELPGTPERRSGWSQRARLAAAAVTILALVPIAWLVWQPERAERANGRVLDELSAGDLDEAADAARRARDVAPHSAQPLYLTARVLAAQGRTTEAYRMLERAVRGHPRDPETWIRLARFELDELDLPRRALETLRGARRADPRSTQAETLEMRAQERLAETG